MKSASLGGRDPFYSQLGTLVLPIMIQFFMLALVSATDAVMLGLVSQESLSSVSLAGQIQFVLNLFLTGVAAGTGILAAQYWGKGDPDSIERVIPTALRSNLACGVLFTLCAGLFPRTLMLIFTDELPLLELGVCYLRAVSPSYFLCALSQIYLTVLKNTGAVAANSIVSIAKSLLSCLIRGVGGGAGIMIGNLLGAGELERARGYGGRLTRLAILTGCLSGGLLALLSPLIVRLVGYDGAVSHDLQGMLLFCGVNMAFQAVNHVVLDGIFCAGGDSRFDMVGNIGAMWCFAVPLGFLAAFWLKLPVLAVYCIVNLDEIVKIPAVYLHYKKYIWVRDITRPGESAGGERSSATF